MPNVQELEFALRIFRELVEPALESLENLLKPSTWDVYIGLSSPYALQALYVMPSGVVTFAGRYSSTTLPDINLILNRHLTIVRNVFAGSPTLYKENISHKDMLDATQTSDILYVLFISGFGSRLNISREEIPEMIASIDPINSGFALTDSDDPRYQYVAGVRARFGNFLHAASVSLRQQGEENTVDAVQILVGYNISLTRVKGF